MFPRLSFDLIYARPGQTLAAWRAELRQALGAGRRSSVAVPAHHRARHAIRGAAPARRDRAARSRTPPRRCTRRTAEEAARFGLLAYEVSNYAVPGGESRHNLAYWRYGDYAGIGPGAHGRLMLGGALRRHPAPPRARSRGPSGSSATATAASRKRRCNRVDRAREMLLMGLRLTEGIDATRFAERTDVALEDALDPSVFEQAISEGYLTWQAGELAATTEGRLRLDALLAALVR